MCPILFGVREKQNNYNMKDVLMQEEITDN
jgi:hypothetical protein